MQRGANATLVLTAFAILAFLLTHYTMNTVAAHVGGGFIPARFSGLIVEGAVPVWLTPLSAAFLHADVLHLLFNMVVLVYCGQALERAIGAARFLALYVLGAYFAALAQWYADPAAALPMIGASGAVSAVIGAYALAFGGRKRIVANRALNRFLNALWLLLFWVAVQYALDLVAAVEGSLIATPAHIGGFVAGLGLWRVVRRRHGGGRGPRQDLR